MSCGGRARRSRNSAPVNAIMDNGWIKSIVVGLIVSLIVTGLTVSGKWVFARHYMWRQAIFSISVATIVFFFGNVLQPAVAFLLEGPFTPSWIVTTAVQYVLGPSLSMLTILVWSLIAAIPTGLAVLKGASLQQRLVYGAIWAPISLTIVDMMAFYVSWHSPFPLYIRAAVVNWHEAYFSLLSNLFGGVVGGVLVGTASHLYSELTTQSTFPPA
jgi:hypothetical protein